MFADYTKDELFSITSKYLREKGKTADTETIISIVEVLNRQKAEGNFGNARAVGNLVKKAVAKFPGKNSFSPRDFLDLGGELPVSPETIMNELLPGSHDEVKKFINDFVKSIEFQRKRGMFRW